MTRATVLRGLLAILPVLLGAGAANAAAGVAVDGWERTRIVPPSGAQVNDYANAGYRLVRRGDEVRIEVDASPLASTAPFEPPRRVAPGPLARLARAQTSGAGSRYEAVSRVLGWVARHIEYELDRQDPQTALAVLERRRGYCTGVARLAVELLRAVDIEAREVAGYVVDDGDRATVYGYHRWIEVYFPDRGWIFSDPLSSHHFVPATYVRLDSGQLRTDLGLDGLLIERRDHVVVVDAAPTAPAGVRVRRVSAMRWAAALAVEIAPAHHGEAVLRGPLQGGNHGPATLYRHRLDSGGATFVGLEPGAYRLRLDLPGRAPIEHELRLAGRERSGLRFNLD